jgi:DNA-binding MarR family transcriptional regulator
VTDDNAEPGDPPPPPRWLDGEESRVWISWVLSTRLLWEELERDLQRDAGLPFSYYEVLVMLSESPGRSRRMSDLADATQTSRSRLSHAITRLEALGWVRREACPNDRRGALAVLTDKGFTALEAAAPHHVESVRTHLFDQLTATQLAQLREISEVLLDHLLPIISSRNEAQGRLEMARARLGGADPPAGCPAPAC